MTGCAEEDKEVDELGEEEDEEPPELYSGDVSSAVKRRRLVVMVRSRKSGRKVMLPQRRRLDWAGGADNPLYMLAWRCLISLLLCFCHDMRYVI